MHLSNEIIEEMIDIYILVATGTPTKTLNCIQSFLIPETAPAPIHKIN